MCLLLHIFCFSDVTVELPLILMTPKPEGALFLINTVIRNILLNA